MRATRPIRNDEMTNRHPRENELFDFTRAFTANEEGERVLAGLTLAETNEYFEYVDHRNAYAYLSAELRDRYLALYDRHERARRAIVMAEVESGRTTKN